MLTQIKSDIDHLLHPKMAFFLTTVGKEGHLNVMACAWATPVSEEPAICHAGLDPASNIFLDSRLRGNDNHVVLRTSSLVR
jgi:flavin reductase (DIM6/NTAB) family NADH-FMN oxidoreductase RutF